MPSKPTVSVQIAAIDQFSATMLKFRRELAESGQAVSGAGGKLALPSLGFSEARAELSAFHNQAKQQLGGLSRLAPGLSVLGGIGTVAGLAEITARYATMGVELGNMAKQAGTTSAGMNSVRGAARMLGLDAGTADQVMVGLNKTLADAFYGKNAGAAAALQQAGIGLTGIAGGAAKAEEKLAPIADYVQRLSRSDPRAAVAFVEKLGLGPEAMNLLGVGSERLAALRAEAAKLSGVTDDGEGSSRRYAEAMGRAGIAADSLGRTVMTTLEPVLTPMLKDLAKWTSEHSTDIQDAFKGIGKAVGVISDFVIEGMRLLREFYGVLTWVFDKAAALGKLVGADKLGGWLKERQQETMAGNVPMAQAPAGPSQYDDEVYKRLDPLQQKLYAMRSDFRERANQQYAPQRYPASGAGNGVANPAAGLAVDQKAAAKASYEFWRGKGYTAEGAASMASMEMGESGGNVAARGDNNRSHGLYQHDPNRRAAIKDATGVDISTETDAARQREATYQEGRQGLDAGAARAFRTISSTNDLQAGVASGVNDFERSADRAGDIRKRLAIARDILRLYGPNSDAVRTAAPEQPDLTRGGRIPQLLAPPVAPAGTAPAGGGGVGSAVRIDLVGQNLPPGLTANARTEGDGAELGTVRLHYAMPERRY